MILILGSEIMVHKDESLKEETMCTKKKKEKKRKKKREAHINTRIGAGGVRSGQSNKHG